MKSSTIIMAGVLVMLIILISASARGAEECATIDPGTVKLWSEPYRGWHYHPDHVIPMNETYYMFYNAVGNTGRGIGLITSKPLAQDKHKLGADVGK